MTRTQNLDALMGADPEYILEKDGRIVPAHDHFRFEGMAGMDGNSSVAELRPRPQDNIIKLVAEIKNIFECVDNKLSDKSIKFLAGHYQCNYAIGGHIHFSIAKRDMIDDLVHRLDKVMVDELIPLLDDTAQFQKRIEHGYGKRGDFHSTTYGIEYRPLGSWLHSPVIATIYLGLAKMVYQATVLDLPVYRDSRKLLLDYLSAKDMYTDDVKIAINLFYDLVKSGYKVNWQENILDNWLADKRGAIA
jgi:hypothetical protein